MSDAQTTARAADLAERIVDAISEADQNWRFIEVCAWELFELAAKRAARQAGRPLRVRT